MIEEQEPKYVSERCSNGYIEKEYQVYTDKEWAIYKIRTIGIYPHPMFPYPVSYAVGRVDGICYSYVVETRTFESAAKILERILKGTDDE
jgi:hypothetical protein